MDLFSVYQRGSVINSQLRDVGRVYNDSISKGIGDQFSAAETMLGLIAQYIKGDR